MAIGANIKRLREEREYSQNELSKLLGISQSLLWKYERGETLPNVVNAAKIAGFFGLTVEELMK